jgi:sugar O-acyltransferase (sialic acid O-acetyltransferase NeuD family)
VSGAASGTVRQRLLLLGAGGHARALIELLRDAGWPEPAGLLDDSAAGTVLGVPVLGPLADLARRREEGIAAAAVAIGDNRLRLALGDRLAAAGYALPSLVHPSALLAGSARLGPGVVVLPRVVLGAAVAVGRLAILNTGAIVEHDGRIGEGAHLAPGAVLGGGVTVGPAATIGIGAALRPGVTIGAGAVVGVGAAVVADVAAGVTVTGVPARAAP